MIEDEFAGVRIKPKSADEFAGVRTRPLKQEASIPEGDSWASFLPKAGLKAATNIADLPSGIENLVSLSSEYSPVNLLSKYFGGPSVTYKPMLPTTSDARAKIKEYTGVDLEPKPSSAAQRITGNVLDFAVPGGMFAKAAKAPTTLGKVFNTAKPIAGAGALGAGSGSLQEIGVNPLVADIGASLTPYGAKKVMQGISKPIKYLLPTAEETARKSFQRQVGQENIPQVLENLDKKFPFDAPATTAELADNVGIAKMHQAMSPNIGAISDKQKDANAILKGKIDNLSTMRNHDPYNLGEIIRDGIENKYQNALTERAFNADPLYHKLLKSTHKTLPLSSLRSHLKQEKTRQVGPLKEELDVISSWANPLKQNRASTTKDQQNIVDEITNIDKKIQEFNKSPAVTSVLRGERDALQQKLLSSEAQKIRKNDLNYPQVDSLLQNLENAKNIKRKAGADKSAKQYELAKTQVYKDILKNKDPDITKARNVYREYSKPVSAIDTNSLLKKFVEKKNRKNPYNEQEITNFVLSPERVPKKILDSSIDETKALMKQIDKNPEMLNAVRSGFIQDLVPKSDAKLSYDKIDKFLTRHKGKLPEVFDNNQIQVLNDAKDILKARNNAENMGRAIGSNTQSETTLLAELATTPISAFGKQAAKILPFGTRISPILSGGYNAVMKAQKQNVHEILKEALADPEKAKLLLMPTKDIKSADQLNSILARLAPISKDLTEIDSMGGQ